MVEIRGRAMSPNDLCEYLFNPLPDVREPNFDSGALEGLAHPGWSLHVGLFRPQHSVLTES